MSDVQHAIEAIGVVIEVVAVGIIVVGLGYALVRSGVAFARREERAYLRLRSNSARILLLGLELLVAADIVRTVALEPSLESVAVLGLLVVIRTFLSWSLVVEIEGRWPWQAERGTPGDPRDQL
jgi:uncharacterized membrane protein